MKSTNQNCGTSIYFKGDRSPNLDFDRPSKGGDGAGDFTPGPGPTKGSAPFDQK